MRQFQDIEKRWSLLFNTSIGVDLRQAIRDDGDFDPCEDGLRSVCWKSFLLNGVLSKATWTRKLKDNRSGYTSLRDHFLKFIDNPNDLDSSTDPLADDDTSPWATLRQDEISREEIWQDVVRCNVDNHFFQEPSTRRRLLDILFIYSKLNPDTGYRQGMHELLAPVLWVVHQDSIDVKLVPETKQEEEGMDFMLNVLDSRYVEHDAFNLFCAIMQTTKSFYEMGEGRESSAIVAQSERIHKELLGVIDPDLSTHLEVVGVVPQIFVIRWLRLLFGREFIFKDVLKLWDSLFAESLHVEVIDLACVAILLRLRWQLIDATYTQAITTLTRMDLPVEAGQPRDIVKDALKLARNRTAETGADITQLRTGRRQYTNPLEDSVDSRAATPPARPRRRFKSEKASSSPSPARFATPQRHFESLFNNVSSSFPKNTEGWSVQNVSKALRGAVGEARKNFEQLQVSHSRNTSVEVRSTTEDAANISPLDDLADRLGKFEERNKALAKMLESAQESLRVWKSASSVSQENVQGEDAFNTALAKLQFVSVYLADSEIPVPPMSPTVEKKPPQSGIPRPAESGQETAAARSQRAEPVEAAIAPAHRSEGFSTPILDPKSPSATPSITTRTSSSSPTRTTATRPSLAESSFSFMLGDDRHRSSFVRPKPLPEERRHSDAQNETEGKNGNDSKVKQKQHTKDKKDGTSSTNPLEGDQDGFTLSTLE